MRLRFDGTGSFLIGPSTVVVEPDPGAHDRAVGNLVVGPAFATLLHLRGHLVLHASCVGFPAGAVAFMGDSAWGKSTLAAACVRAGHRLIADDTTAFAIDGPDGIAPEAIPAYPRIKLFADALAALGLDPDALEPIHPANPKRVLHADDGFTWEPAPLRRIYLLDGADEGAPTSIEPLESSDAFVELVRHTFAVDLLEMTDTRERHFAQVSALASRVSVSRLRVGASLARVTDIPAVVRADLGA